MFRRATSAWLLPRRRSLRNGIGLDSRAEEAFLESLTVIVIVAILLGSAFASYRPALNKATMSEAMSLMVTFKTEIATELAVTGQLPASIRPWDEPSSFGGNYFSGIEWLDQEIVVPLRADGAGAIASADSSGNASGEVPPLTLSFRVARSTELGRPLILCGLAEPPAGFEAAPVRHTTVPKQYLPFFCRV